MLDGTRAWRWSVNLENVVATVLASGLGAFIAASLGFRYAMSRFRRERAFDRRLEWYERTVQRLTHVHTALTFAQASDAVPISAEDRDAAWAEAWQAVLSLRGLDVESELFATPRSYEALREALADIATASQAALKHGQPGTGPNKQFLVVTGKLIRHATATLAADVRQHLELEPIMREWTIYDHEIRELEDELADLREKGILNR